MQDLKDEFDKVASTRLSELKALRSGGKLSLIDEKLLLAIEKRMEAHVDNRKVWDFTLTQMLHHFNARLFKPQRLVSLTYEEDERRALRSWHRFGCKLNVACFRPLEELADVVKDPQAFRKHVRDWVMFMTDQTPHVAEAEAR